MSKKPIKKSDLEKSWLQPRRGREKRFAPGIKVYKLVESVKSYL